MLAGDQWWPCTCGGRLRLAAPSPTREKWSGHVAPSAECTRGGKSRALDGVEGGGGGGKKVPTAAAD